MFRTSTAALLWLLTICSAVGGQAPAAPVALADRDIKRLDQLAEKLAQGRLSAVHELAQPLVESFTPQEIEAVGKHLAGKGIGEPLPELMLNARLQLILEDQGKRIRRPGKKELALTLPFLAERAAEILKSAEEEVNTGLPAVIPHEIVDERLEVLPKLMTQVEQAQWIYEHLLLLCRRLRPADLAGMDPAVQDQAKRKWQDQIEILGPIHDQLVERVVSLCMLQLRDMIAVLENRSVLYRDRFEASRRIRTALSLLEKYKRPFEKRQARNPAMESPKELYAEAESHAKNYRRLASELERKSFLLEEGVRWWIRGRFGQGPLDGGLAKALPYGTRRLEDALLYYPLRLPNPIKHPPDPNKNPLRVPVPRRHIEYWVSEGSVATIARLPADFVIDRADPNWPQAVLSAREYQDLLNRLDFNDASVGYVGYLEYQMALLYFEALLRLCNDAELEAIDAMVAEDDRLVVHSNISRQYNGFAQDSTLRYEFPRTSDPRASGDYERRGLRWMMALARLELGAMIAARIPRMRVPTTTTRPLDEPLRPGVKRINGRNINAPIVIGPDGKPLPTTEEHFVSQPRDPNLQPFSMWPPTPFELEAFTELLWDAARQHYYSLRTEFLFTNRSNNQAPDPLVGRLLTRFAVASEALKATEQLSGQRLTAAQLKELRFWQSWIENTRSRVEQTLAPSVLISGPFGVQTP